MHQKLIRGKRLNESVTLCPEDLEISWKMWHYVLILLAVQSACAAPILPCVKVKYYIVDELDTLTRATLTQFAEILQRIIEETERIDVSESDRQILDRFVKIIEHSTQLGDYDDPMLVFDELLDEISDFIDSLESDESDSFSQSLLLKYGMNSFEQNMDKLAADSLRRLEKHIMAYLKTIRNNKSLEFEWKNWITEFKSETDIENKVDLLEEFWDALEC